MKKPPGRPKLPPKTIADRLKSAAAAFLTKNGWRVVVVSEISISQQPGAYELRIAFRGVPSGPIV